MTDWHEALRDFALSLPEAWEDHPWEETVIKVNKKIFLFLGTEGFGVKLLSETHGHALSVTGAAPSGYGLGKAGWVSVPAAADLPDIEVLMDWVEESYRAIAPKRAIKLLDDQAQGEADQ